VSNVVKEERRHARVIEGRVTTGYGEYRRHLGAEDERARHFGVDERLLANTVARTEQDAFSAIEKGEGKHSAEMSQDVGPIHAVGFEQNLGV
jgi:hypothetical protein